MGRSGCREGPHGLQPSVDSGFPCYTLLYHLVLQLVHFQMKPKAHRVHYYLPFVRICEDATHQEARDPNPFDNMPLCMFVEEALP
jgi:hypothetical protein